MCRWSSWRRSGAKFTSKEKHKPIDSLTHIVLGACIGEAMAGKKLGKKALWIGAAAQSLPDIDFLFAFWADPATNLLMHRGITHSLMFGAFAAITISAILQKYYRRSIAPGLHWYVLIAVEIGVHLLLDVCNQYGMGLFEPFSQQRFSVNSIFVADPLFSIWPLIAVLALLLVRAAHRKRIFWYRFGILLPALYLLYCFFNKWTIDRATRKDLHMQGLPAQQYLTTPTPLNNWLWYTVAGNEKGFYVGYRSVFHAGEKLAYSFFPRNDHLLAGAKNQHEVKQLLRFSQGFYTVEQWGDTLVFNDLRFGQIIGWQDPKERFVFHFFLHPGADNKLVVQRGRFAKWNSSSMDAMWRRIRGAGSH